MRYFGSGVGELRLRMILHRVYEGGFWEVELGLGKGLYIGGWSSGVLAYYFRRSVWRCKKESDET